jgi:hypothetical protein
MTSLVSGSSNSAPTTYRQRRASISHFWNAAPGDDRGCQAGDDRGHQAQSPWEITSRQSLGYTVVKQFPQRRIAPKETTVSQASVETIAVGQLGVLRRAALDSALPEAS